MERRHQPVYRIPRRGEPAPASNDPALPEVIGDATRADLVLTKSDLPENWVHRPPFDPETLPPLQLRAERPPGLAVEIEPLRIRVRYHGKPILIVRWMPQGQMFWVKRAYSVRAKTVQWVEGEMPLDEVWRLCGEHQVTKEEFQQAFHSIDTDVEFRFELCPYQRLDCKFRYDGDPRKTKAPEYTCTTCNSRFGTVVEPGTGKEKLFIKEVGKCQPSTSSATAPMAAEPSSNDSTAEKARQVRDARRVVDGRVASSAVEHGLATSGWGSLNHTTPMPWEQPSSPGDSKSDSSEKPPTEPSASSATGPDTASKSAESASSPAAPQASPKPSSTTPSAASETKMSSGRRKSVSRRKRSSGTRGKR